MGLVQAKEKVEPIEHTCREKELVKPRKDVENMPPRSFSNNTLCAKNSSKKHHKGERKRSCPIPVQCVHCGYEEQDAVAKLKTYYDMRTWNMFWRITHAREETQQHLPSHGDHVPQITQQPPFAGMHDGRNLTCDLCLPDAPTIAAAPFDASHCPFYPECEECDHLMIFGDLE